MQRFDSTSLRPDTMTPRFTVSLLALLAPLALVTGCNTRVSGAALVAPHESVAVAGDGRSVRVLRSSADSTGGICRLHDLSATFDTPMDPDSIDERRFVLTDAGVPVVGYVSLDGTGRTARFVPADPAGFAPSRTIVASLRSGAGGVRSRTGRTLAEDHSWVFSTGWQTCNGRGLMAPALRSPTSPGTGATPAASSTAAPR